MERDKQKNTKKRDKVGFDFDLVMYLHKVPAYVIARELGISPGMLSVMRRSGKIHKKYIPALNNRFGDVSNCIIEHRDDDHR